MLEFARGVDATQLVIGTSRRSRLARVLVESIGTRVVQDSGHIDVHMVTHPEAGRGDPPPPPVQRRPGHRRAAGWALGLLLPLAAVGIGILGRDMLGLSTDVVLFFLATVVTALVGGLGPALLAAVASGLLLNFFLTPPLYTFTISERENVITLVVMVLVAVLVALVVDRAARRAQQAAQARAEATLLASFSRTVLARSDPLPRLLEQDPGGVRPDVGGDPAAQGRPLGRCPRARDRRGAPAPRTGRRRRRGRRSTSTSSADGRALAAAERRLLEAVAGQALLALRNQQVSAEAAEAKPPRRRHRAAHARCCRPSATTCARRSRRSRPPPAACATRTCSCPRPTAASWRPRSRSPPTGSPAWSTTCSTPPGSPPAPSPRSCSRSRYDEVALLALRGLDGVGPRPPRSRPTTSPRSSPTPACSSGWSPTWSTTPCGTARGSPVTLRGSVLPGDGAAGRTQADLVELRVVDAGPGVPRGESDRLFAPFQRLGDREPRGLGLGLSVARGFTEAMGGTLTAEDTPGGGLTMVVSLPAATSPARRRHRRAPAEPAELAP